MYQQQTLSSLQAIRDGSRVELQAHHFRAVTTLFDLKHALPATLHAQLISTLVDVLWVPGEPLIHDVDLENRALKVLATLLHTWKKRQRYAGKLSQGEQSEIVIDWRLARRAIARACFSSPGYVRRASQLWLAQIASNTVKCVERARSFFRATREDAPLVAELWGEFGPSIKNTNSMDCFSSLGFLSLLAALPEDSELARGAVSALVPEMMQAWSSISRCAEWDKHWMKVLSRIAKKYPGAEMWEPFLPFVFAKVHDSLALPSDLGAPWKDHSWPTAAMTLNGSNAFERYTTRLCIYLLRNSADSDVETSANRYLQEILHTLKDFFHPSNVSNVAGSVAVVLQSLSKQLAIRLGSEKASPSPSPGNLTLTTCHPILDELLKIGQLGIYSKNRAVASKCVLVIKNIVCIDPVQYANAVLEDMVKALDPTAMSQSHLAATAISTMSSFLYHLMNGRHKLSTGLFFGTYLTPILKLTLPGIDANDEKKTMSTTLLYFQILSWLPLVNDPGKSAFQATKTRGSLSSALFDDMKASSFVEVSALDPETDQRLWEIGSFLEEWALGLLDRCFQFFTSRASVVEHTTSSGDQGKRGRSSRNDGNDDKIALQVANMLSLFYAQLSPELYNQALRKTTAFVSNLFFTTSSSGNLVAQLLYSCMQGNPAMAFKHFSAIVFDKLRVTKTGIDVSGLSTSEKIWNLYILNGIVRLNDPDDRFLLHYSDELRVILHHFLTKEDDKEIYEAAATVLQHLLHALLGVYTHDFRSLSRNEWLDAVSNDSGAFQYFGASSSWKSLSIAWHEPNAEELAFGFELLQDHLIRPMNELKELESSKDTTVRSWLPRLNRLVHSVRGAASVLVDGEIAVRDNALLSGAAPLLTAALSENNELLSSYLGLKPATMDRVHELVTFWRENGTGGTIEIPVVHLLVDTIGQLLIWCGKPNSEFRMKAKHSKYAKSSVADIASHAYRKAQGKGESHSIIDPSALASRNDMVEMVNFFYEKRNNQQHFALANSILQRSDSDSTKQRYERLLGDVESLLKNPYEDVRADAAGVMQESHEMYAKWLYSRLPTLIDDLEGKSQASGTLQEEAVSGIVFMLTLTIARRNLWRRRDGLLPRALTILVKSDILVVNRIDGEAKKAKASAKLQTYFMTLVASWRVIHREQLSSAIDDLVKIEPESSEHWKFHLLHLVALFPFLQPEAAPFSSALWNLIIRKLQHEVLPVRQVALILYAQLTALLKQQKTKLQDEAATALIYSNDTMQVLMTAILDNHKNSNRFAASADGQHADSAPSNWSFGVNEVIRHLSAGANSFPKSPYLSSVRLMNRPTETMSKINLHTVKLVEKLVLLNPSQFFASGALERLIDLATEQIDAKAGIEERQATLSTVADWTAGIFHGLLKTSSLQDEELASHLDKVVVILKRSLPSLSVVLVDQWMQVLYLASRPSKHRQLPLERLAPVTTYLIEELEDSFTHATDEGYARQAKWLALIEAVVTQLLGVASAASSVASAELEPVQSLTATVCNRLLSVLTTHALSHQYKIIRECVARLLSALSIYGRSPRLSVPPGLDSSAIPLSVLVRATGLDWSSESKQSSDDGKDDGESATLSAKETAMHWLEHCQQIGDASDVTTVLPQLLPIALLSQNHPKAEVAVLAKNTVDAVAKSLRLFHVPNGLTADADVGTLLNLLTSMARSLIWKTRAAVIRFLMTFAFYHWTMLSGDERQRVHDLVSSFLTDEQREVQAMAKFALRSLVHSESEEAVRAMSVRLTDDAQQARVKFPKQKRRLERLEKEAAAPDEITQARERIQATEARMTRSVLGMSAIVLAFPHETPAFVPPMFEELGKFLYVKAKSSTVSFLEKAVKETLLEFRRTHQDNWQDTKARFTAAQLDVLEDVAIAPSYFS